MASVTINLSEFPLVITKRVQCTQGRSDAGGSPGGTLKLEDNVADAQPDWFVDAASGNLRLVETATRPIDAGVPVSEVAEDFDGLPRTVGKLPDAGAFELRAWRQQ